MCPFGHFILSHKMSFQLFCWSFLNILSPWRLISACYIYEKIANIHQCKKSTQVIENFSEELFKGGMNPDITHFEMRLEQALNVPAREMLMVTVYFLLLHWNLPVKIKNNCIQLEVVKARWHNVQHSWCQLAESTGTLTVSCECTTYTFSATF